MKVLKGQPLREQDYADVERQLRDLFYLLVFKPVVELLAPRNAQVKAAIKELKNSSGELRNAKFDPIVSGINSGKIQYVGDTFSGDFSAAISRALRSYGARYNKRDKTFTIMASELPEQVTEAASSYASTARKLHDLLMTRLNEVQQSLSRMADAHPVDGHVVIGKMDKRFQHAYKDALGTEDMSDAAKKKLNRAYSDSLTPYVKKFSDEMVEELRGMVRDNAEQGYRFDSLVDRIQGRFDVTKSKAAFLARNETSRFTSEHRRQRFGDVGVRQYVWQTAGDAEVRKDHAKLNGKVFDYAHPPVVDEASGRRANPGMDFQCRCVDSPLLPGVLANA